MTDKLNRFTISSGKHNTVSSQLNANKSSNSDGNTSKHAAPNTALDLVFVIDSTGSMSGKINALMSMCEQFVDDLTKSKISYRAAVVAFGDLTVSGDKISATPFTANVQTIKSLLQRLPQNSGGANEGESCFEAIQAALKLPFQDKCMKVVVLMTDEPALQHNVAPQQIQGKLVSDGCMLFAFATGEQYYKSFARVTGGSWWDIESTTSLDSVLAVLKKLAASVTSTVTNVARLAGGDVKKYLQLTK
jgi:hypothetical protein